MAAFFFIVFSALAWMGLRGDISVVAFVVGAFIGLGMWRLFRFESRRPFSVVRAIQLTALGVSLFVVFFVDLVLANISQLRIILAPRIAVRPYWLEFRTDLESPAMRAVLGTMIVMTPGTLAYGDVEAEGGGWLIGMHALHA